MSDIFSQYIKIIGKGQKGGRSLTRDEAYAAMKMVLAGKVTGEQRGAFLMLLRTREETPDEIAGFLDACRELITPAVKHLPAAIDVGCYAGKRRQLPWYLLSLACLCKAGYPVFMHGAHEPGSGRLYASYVLEALGLPTAKSVSAASAQLQKQQATYLDLSYVLKPLDDIIKLREVFGLRSCANTLGRLLNPTLSKYSVQGVFHTGLDTKHARVNEAFTSYDSLCFRGDGGDPEVNRERDTVLHITRAGATEATTLVAHDDRWALKERHMSAQTMLSVWAKKQAHRYAEQSVVGTLTALLMLCESIEEDAAREQAQTLWQHRDSRMLPFQ
ncbi:glycosyl transferase family protein [Salinimonas chungwhensis]|uniref:glycosyl transferase family protein n=1 Tax=Salinimonas chungwhensis TaxID=265425 RepID=UPI0003787A93|nr:glycosyl transferase family protein [Salinimonas chungwhensis]